MGGCVVPGAGGAGGAGGGGGGAGARGGGGCAGSSDKICARAPLDIETANAAAAIADTRGPLRMVLPNAIDAWSIVSVLPDP